MLIKKSLPIHCVAASLEKWPLFLSLKRFSLRTPAMEQYSNYSFFYNCQFQSLYKSGTLCPYTVSVKHHHHVQHQAAEVMMFLHNDLLISSTTVHLLWYYANPSSILSLCQSLSLISSLFQTVTQLTFSFW